MLKPVSLGSKRFLDYREVTEEALFAEILQLAKGLAGRRILHINSTPTGGGVAEILNAEVPLLNDLGLAASWLTITGTPEFFAATTKIHNALQGGPAPTAAQWQVYRDYSRHLAAQIDPTEWDLVVIHDPQPAAIRNFVKSVSASKWVWRYHADCSDANPATIEQLESYLGAYDGAVFSLDSYVLVGVRWPHLGVIPVAIDPLSVKNRPMERAEAVAIISKYGLDPGRPLVAQVSRFDQWKDPLGVIEAWQLARAKVPDLQLALVGNSARDNLDGQRILAQVRQMAQDQPDLFVIADQASDREVKGFYTAANATIQKSLREGFGLTVAEALWAGTPVIGGRVGGIVQQITHGESGYLVTSIEETAERMVELVNNKTRALAMGAFGREQVRQHYLLPRLIRDDLKFWTQVLN